MNDFEVVGTVRVNDDGSLSLINGNLEAMASKTGSLGGIMQTLGNISQYVWANIILRYVNMAITAVGQFASNVIKSAESIQESHALINRALISTKDASGLTSAQLDKYAESLSRATKFSMDEALQAEAMGLQFTNINKNIWPQALGLAADLATKMGSDLPTATQQLFRALQDPINGFGRLTMVIGQVSPPLKKSIEDAAKHGYIAKADAQIMNYLSTAIGGAAQAAGETFSGAWTKMTNLMSDSLSIAFLPVLDMLGKFIDNLMQTGVVDRFAASMAGLVTGASNFIIALSKAKELSPAQLFASFVDTIGRLGDEISGKFYLAMANIDWHKVSDNIAEGIRTVNWSLLGSRFADGIRFVIGGLVTFINNVDWGALFGSALMAMGDFITGFLQPGATFQKNVIDVWAADWQQLVQIVASLKYKIVVAILTWLSEIDHTLRIIAQDFFERGIGWVDQAAKGVIQGIGNLIAAINRMKAIVIAAIGIGIIIPVAFDLPSLGPIMNLIAQAQGLVAGVSGMASLKKGGAGGGAKLTRRALGGPIETGNFYVVGENGPEIFVPNISGMIIPNYGKSTSGAQTVGAGSSNFYFYGNVSFGGTPAAPSELMQTMRRT